MCRGAVLQPVSRGQQTLISREAKSAWRLAAARLAQGELMRWRRLQGSSEADAFHPLRAASSRPALRLPEGAPPRHLSPTLLPVFPTKHAVAAGAALQREALQLHGRKSSRLRVWTWIQLISSHQQRALTLLCPSRLSTTGTSSWGPRARTSLLSLTPARPTSGSRQCTASAKPAVRLRHPTPQGTGPGRCRRWVQCGQASLGVRTA